MPKLNVIYKNKQKTPLISIYNASYLTNNINAEYMPVVNIIYIISTC